LEHAGELIDYMALHWYVGNDAQRGYRDDDFASYMAVSELLEDRLSSYEGLIRALMLDNKLKKPIHIAVDEWNVWYRVHNEGKLEEIYNLEDALMTGIQLNSFIRHASSVKVANIAQIVNVIAPVMTRPDGMYLQTIFYPFEVYSQTAGDTALDVFWTGDTFSTPEHEAVRFLDVSATLDTKGKKLALYVVNRSLDQAIETEVSVLEGQFSGGGKAHIINGADIKTVNSFDAPDGVTTREESLSASGSSTTYTFEPHSVTALVFDLG
jgi:alpha-N-arabinofuranosidase